MKDEAKLEGVIDRIENGRVFILVSGGGEMLLPADKLPAGAGEGTVLAFTAAVDAKAREERRKKALRAQERLRGRKKP